MGWADLDSSYAASLIKVGAAWDQKTYDTHQSSIKKAEEATAKYRAEQRKADEARVKQYTAAPAPVKTAKTKYEDKPAG